MKRALSLLLLTSACAFAQMDDVAFIGSLSDTNAISPSFAISTNGLAAWWKLDETSGNRADSTTNAQTLTATGASYNVGIINNAANFISTSSQYLLRSTPATTITNNGIYIALWVYMTNIAAGYYCPIGKLANFKDEYALEINGTTQKAEFFLSETGVGTWTSVAANDFGVLSPNTWYFLEGWWVPGSVIGVAVNRTETTLAYTKVMRPQDGALAIGREGGIANSYFDGRIDEASLWFRVLNSSERDYLYNSGSGRTFP